MTSSADGPVEADELHEPPSKDPWFTETAWYSFWTTGKEFAVHVYLRFRPNLDWADSCVYAWEPGASVPWDAAYWKHLLRTLATVGPVKPAIRARSPEAL